MHLAELFAGPMAVDALPEAFAGREFVHFVDNNGVLGSIVKGYSSVDDSLKVVCHYWLRAPANRICSYVDRVDSPANIAEDPSTLNVKGAMACLGAQYCPPCLDHLNSPAPVRDHRMARRFRAS